MTLSEIAIRRPVFTTMLSVGIVVLGVVGLSRLGVNLFPDVEFPVVSVTTIYPGASPEEVESQITEPIEDALVSINGIDQLVTYSRDSVSQVVIMFELDVDIEEAAVQVRERVSQVRARLPREIEEPAVGRLDVAAAPVLTYTLSGDRPLQELRELGEDVIAPALEQVDGVAAVRVRGGRERQVNVLLDLDAVRARGLTPTQIVDRIRVENLSVPAGGYDEGDQRVTVRTLGELRDVAELRRLAIATGQDGSLVRLGEVATVEDGFEDETLQVRTNGAPAVVIDVLKASGKNTVEVVEGAQARLADLRLPDGVRVSPIVDQAEFVLENVHEVEVALIFGGAMAILVILLFMLDLRSTLISAVALPTSVIGSFFLMYAFGYTLNMMTLLGLSLAIGLLIDDSIVVRENIVKHLERGVPPIEAAERGTREITLAVIATTLTLCAVFVPVAFTEGIVGQFFREFGITVAGATVISTWVALTLDPMLSAKLARQLRRAPDGSFHREHERFGWLKRPFLVVFRELDLLYLATLRWITARKRNMALIGVAAVLVFAGSCSLVPLMGNEFMAPEDRGQFTVSILLPAGTSLQRTSELTLAAERALLRDRRFVTVYSTVGGTGDPNQVDWRVIMVPKWERTAGLAEMQQIARETVQRNVPEANVFVSLPGIVEGGRNYPIAYYVQGEDYGELARTAYRFGEILRGTPGAADVDVDYQPGKPEVQIAVDRDRAAQMGVPVALVARTVRASMEGEVAGKLRDGDDEIDIRVRLREEDRASESLVARLQVPSPRGFVPVADLARLSRGEGPAVIERLDRQRTIKVTAAADGRPLGDIVAEATRKIEAESLPPGITWQLLGDAKMMQESNENLGLALLLGILFIYLVLASQFESFVHPITIMMALPLAVVGAMVALFLQGSSLSMGAMIGIILLMGLVTKNGILLVDHAVVKVREGWTPVAAILDAGPARLRPILMTSAAMVLGMLPTAVGEGPGSEFRSPMAMGVIGGVISSTFLTLFVVPVIYLAVEALRTRARRLFSRRQPEPDPNAAE